MRRPSQTITLYMVLAIISGSVYGWSQQYQNNRAHVPTTAKSNNDKNDEMHSISRRGMLQGASAAFAALVGTTGMMTFPSQAFAASVPSPAELERVRKGQARVKYLLNNWDDITQICGKIVMSDTERKQIVRTEGSGSAGCEKTPLNVQEYMGYKSTEDPLYRVEKLLVRAAQLIDDPDDFEKYLETVEKYKEKADNTALMAYTSSWGEANPNGGKEVIDEYLERTKLDVIESEEYLTSILKYLKLEPLPPAKNP